MKQTKLKQLLQSSLQAYYDADYKKAYANLNKFNRLKGVKNLEVCFLDARINIALGKQDKALKALTLADCYQMTITEKLEFHQLHTTICQQNFQDDNAIYHLEQSTLLDTSINNSADFYSLLSLYVKQERYGDIDLLSEKLLKWKSYYMPTMLLLIDVAFSLGCRKLINERSDSFVNHFSYIPIEGLEDVFTKLIEVNALTQAELLLARSIRECGDLAWHKTANAIIKVKHGDLKQAMQLFDESKAYQSVYALEFYRALKQSYFEQGKIDSFFGLIDRYNDDFYKVEFAEEYISVGDLDALLRIQIPQSKYKYLTCLVEYNQLIALWIKGDINQCREIINKNADFISEVNVEKHLVVPQVFFRYIYALLKHSSKHKSLLPRNDDESLFVIGESHSLALSNRILAINDVRYNVINKFVKGVQMHHLNNKEINNEKHRYYVERHIDSIPVNANLMFVVGEIDCRIEKGISRAARKKGVELALLVDETVSDYTVFIKKIIADKLANSVFIHGIPAPNIQNNPRLDNQRHNDVICMVNTALRQEVVANGWRFIDVYEVTVGDSGCSHGKWHIDDYHLKPSLYDNLNQFLCY